MPKLNALHLNGLRAIECVARLGSLQKAADELGVSPSAVSQLVNRTEKQLGRPVFQRTRAGLVPTAFGKPFTARLSAGFRELSEALALTEERDLNTLVVSVAPAFASRWLVPRLSRFYALHPDIRLRIDASTALIDLDRSDVDLAIRLGSGDWPGADAELLLAQTVFPVCTPAIAARLTSPADLARHPIIIDENTMTSWQVWFRNAGVEAVKLADCGPSFTDPVLGIDAAISGQGIALAWQILAADALADGRLVAPFGVTAASGLGYYIVTSPAKKPSRKVAHFKRWLQTEITATMERFGTAAQTPTDSISPAGALQAASTDG